MVVFLKHSASTPAINELIAAIKACKANAVYLQAHHVLVVTNTNQEVINLLSNNTMADSVLQIHTPYKFASVEFKNNTTFHVKGEPIGTNHFNITAGPCSVESEEQIFETASFLHKNNIRFIRGGAYKPRTSPYTFKGLGLQGLKLIREAANHYNLIVVTELLDLKLLDEVYEYADILQVGSRNMSNFYMLTELGKIDKPVLLKRGMSAKISEWLLAADYILSGGNEKLILCERGIRSFDTELRNVLDIGGISLVKELSHLPVWADPSHATGKAGLVKPAALAAAAAGANGLMIEIHPNPEKALSDARQAVDFNTFENILSDLSHIMQLHAQKFQNISA